MCRVSSVYCCIIRCCMIGCCIIDRRHTTLADRIFQSDHSAPAGGRSVGHGAYLSTARWPSERSDVVPWKKNKMTRGLGTLYLHAVVCLVSAEVTAVGYAPIEHGLLRGAVPVRSADAIRGHIASCASTACCVPLPQLFHVSKRRVHKGGGGTETTRR